MMLKIVAKSLGKRQTGAQDLSLHRVLLINVGASARDVSRPSENHLSYDRGRHTMNGENK